MRIFRWQFSLTVLVLAIVLSAFRRFLESVEVRPGIVLADPVLALFSPSDFTVLSFILIYGALLLAIAVLISRPVRLLHAMLAYVVMVTIRTAFMFVVPLDPPALMIALNDPLVEFFGSGTVLTKDLFFSGHTATMVLLALAMPGKGFRVAFLCATGVLAFLLLGQHVHYTIDILVAPLAAYGAWVVARRAVRRIPAEG